MPLTQEQRDVIQKGADYASLKEHPGFKALVAEVRKALSKEWAQLLTVKPQELQFSQGFIAGVNFVLEYADESVSEAGLHLEQELREKEQALEESRIAANFERQTVHRRVRAGADQGFGED